MNSRLFLATFVATLSSMAWAGSNCVQANIPNLSLNGTPVSSCFYTAQTAQQDGLAFKPVPAQYFSGLADGIAAFVKALNPHYANDPRLQAYFANSKRGPKWESIFCM